MKPLIRLSRDGQETEEQKCFREKMEKFKRQQEEENWQKKRKVVLEKFNNLQAQAGRECGNFHNFCVAIECSYLTPVRVKKLFKELNVDGPDGEYSEDELLKWLGELAMGNVEIPEPPVW